MSDDLPALFHSIERRLDALAAHVDRRDDSLTSEVEGLKDDVHPAGARLMAAHPMVPSDYTTPDSLRVLDDATRVGGALAGILAAVIAAGVGLRRWWHRKRDRQERLLREVVASVESRLDEMHEDITAIRAAQVRHLEAHAEGRAL